MNSQSCSLVMVPPLLIHFSRTHARTVNSLSLFKYFELTRIPKVCQQNSFSTFKKLQGKPPNHEEPSIEWGLQMFVHTESTPSKPNICERSKFLQDINLKGLRRSDKWDGCLVCNANDFSATAVI